MQLCGGAEEKEKDRMMRTLWVPKFLVGFLSSLIESKIYISENP